MVSSANSGSFLLHTVKDANKEAAVSKKIAFVLFINILTAVLSFYQGKANVSWIAAANANDRFALVFNLALLTFIGAVIKILNHWRYKVLVRDVLPPLRRMTFAKFYTDWRRANLDWLKSRNSQEDKSAFSKGADSLKEVVSSTLNMATPLEN